MLKLLQEAVWNSVVSVATEDRQFFSPATHFSGPILAAGVAYDFTAEPMLLLDVSTSQ